MPNVQWTDILTCCLIGFNFIIALIILNWTICFYLLKHYQCLKPRQPIIPILIGIFSVIFCGIDRSQVLLHSCLSQPIEYDGWMIVNAICFQLWALTLFLIAYRAWNIYYDIKFNTCLKDKQWRLYINPAENNWFLKQRKKYGNPNKMIFVFIIPWIITAVIYLICISYTTEFTVFSRLTLIFQSTIVMIFLIYIWYKIPKFDDVWRIRQELILTIRIFVIGSAVFTVLGLILNWQPPNWKYALLSTMGTIGAFLICYCVLFYPLRKFHLPIWFCGACYLYQHKTKIDFSKRGYKKKQSLNSGTDVDLTVDNEEKKNQMSTQFFKLKAILYHKNGFRLFAAHLMKEFAIENLLFFVETSQWMELIINKCEQENVEITIDEKASGIDVKFHKNVPKSRIVCWNREDDRLIVNSIAGNLNSDIDGVDTTASGGIHSGISSGLSANGPRTSGTLTAMSTTSRSGMTGRSAHATQLTIDLNLDEFELSRPIHDPWLQCIKLFYKYIVNGSYFCINISGENRLELYDKLGYDTSSTKCDEELLETLKEECNNDLDKLFHMFDTARYAVFRLMIYSVSRFETSDAYLEHFMPTEH